MLLGCQCFAPVTVTGSIQRGAVIEVEGSSSALSRNAIVFELSIHDRNADSSVPLWHVTGKGRVSSVTYGSVPRGMSGDAPAKPLEPGHSYVVVVYADTAGSFAFGSYCRGRYTFNINSFGEISNCSEEGTACG
jgi:hypothetical protein